MDVENKIGAGLIEEVIQVAEGELKLTDILLKAKVYVFGIPLFRRRRLSFDLQMGRSRREASSGTVVLL